MKTSSLASVAGVAMLLASVAQAAPLSVPETSWTLAILPDTQHYEGAYESIFAAQTQFLADYKDELNLRYVLQEGDLTQKNLAAQWTTASNAFAILDAADIPYTITSGNHDITQSRSSLMGGYFSASRLQQANSTSYSSFGGIYSDATTSVQNSYSLFNAGGTDWLVIGLEFGPRDGVVDWAKGLMDLYSGDVSGYARREVMIVTHANLYCDSTLYDWAARGDDDTAANGQDANPHEYYPTSGGLAGGCNDGAEMWDVFKDCDNLKFVFNGHVLGDQTGYLAQTGVGGNVVHNVLANYQDCDNGGDGYLRLLEFAADGTVHVRTYSPTRGTSGEYLDKTDQDFVIGSNAMPSVNTRAAAANVQVTGGVSSGTFTLSVPQSGSPTLGVPGWQSDLGDYEIVVGNQDVTFSKGVLMATVRENLRETYRATVEVGRNTFTDCQMALSVTRAGSGAEVNFNTSVAWFGFDAGWRAAHVNRDGTLAAANGVTAAMVTKNDTGRFTVDLGVDSAQDGLLFVIGNNDGNKVVQTGLLADGSWDVRVQTNLAQFAAAGSDADWSLLYLPIATPNLVGGLFDGTSLTNVLSAGQFTMTRDGSNVGRYVLSIAGETPESGMLILTVAREATSGGVTAPDDNILNYETGPDGTFIINSFDLTGGTTLNAQNTNFAWAFISFANPIGTLPGDANGDCVVDDLDAQQLAANWLKSSGATWWDGDFNHDGRVDDRDAAILAAHWQRGAGGSEVPEPGTLALLAAGLAAILFARCRRV